MSSEKQSPPPIEEPFSECDEPQSECTDSSKDYISYEQMSQEIHGRYDKNNSDSTNPVRQQKRKIPVEETEETDYFEDTDNTPSFSSDDNKVHLKKAVILEKKTDPKKMRLDFDRINELDKFKNIPPARSFFNYSLVPQGEDSKKSVFDYLQDSSPGPSDLMPKKKKRAKKPVEAAEDDSSVEEDVKAIVADCIVENTLNVLDITGVTVYTDDIIELNVEAPSVLPSPQECVKTPEDPVDSLGISGENATNSLYDSLEKIQIQKVSDADPEIANTTSHNLESYKDSRTDKTDTVVPEDAREDISPTEESVEDEEDADGVALSVARASREALCDPSSVPDLLEDFEIPPPVQEADNILVDAIEFVNGAILIGILPPGNLTESQAVTEGFPHWLLQILGSQVAVEEAANPAENIDEPHYYCQGDGLGVHPSVVAVEVEEDDDDDEAEESTETSSNNTAAEVDQGVSSQDMSSLPEDSQANTETQEQLPEEADEDEGVLLESSEHVEFFDTLSSSSDTGISTSKTI